LSTKSDQLEWRRTKVIEMRARGLSYQEIARELQVSKLPSFLMCNIYVSRLKELSKNTLQSTYQNNTKVCLTALDEIIKRAFEILETSDDNREKLQAMELFKDTHLVKLELLSNATTIDSALNYIKSKQQQQQKKTPVLRFN
jgi:hypothetical protein